MNTDEEIYLAIQCVNLIIALLFLFSFIYRMIKLRHISITMRYLDLFPKTRVFLAIIYVLLSLVLLIIDIIAAQFPQSQAYMYILAGGGGQCINSLILIFQLIVLRQQLIKERPYTAMHMFYSVFLLVISVARLGLTLYYWLGEHPSEVMLTVFDTIMSCLLSLTSLALFVSWLKKRQSLPQFQDVTDFDFSSIFREKSIRLINSKNGKNINYHPKQQRQFELIYPTVKVEKNKFKIICEIWSNNKIVEIQQTDSHRYSGGSSKHLQILSQSLYTIDQLRYFYINCGRFNINTTVEFTDNNYFQIYRKLQIFFSELLAQPKYYQRFVLQFLNIPEINIQNYQQHLKYQQFIDSKEIHSDPNATYLSVTIYKQLWTGDHYQFYMRVITTNNLYKSYPMKRYSDFEQLDSLLKQILSDRMGHKIVLPSLPKKHYLLMDENKINERRKQLQQYLRKLSNDKTVIESPQLRQKILQFLNLEKQVLIISPTFNQKYFEGLDILKGMITKALIQNQYVTYYEFRLFNNGVEFGKINKRYREFLALHKDIQRWMNNIQIRYESIQLPQRHLYKSQETRHQKLKNYLKNIIEIDHCYQIYQLGVFLNIPADAQLQDVSLFSEITTFRKIQQRQTPNSPKKNINSPTEFKKSPNWVQMRDSPSAQKRWSQLIDDLGVSHQQ